MINKNANGTNKLSRQKNKAKKYLNIDLVDYSNTYWYITDFDKENTFILFTNYRIVKNGEMVIIEPLNRIREYFKKSFGVIFEERPYYYSPFVIFQSYGEQQHQELLELCRGYDDIYLLDYWIMENQHTPGRMLIKKATSGYLDKDGNLQKTQRQKILANSQSETLRNDLLEELE